MATRRKKKFYLFLILIFFASLITTGVLWGYDWWMTRKARFVRYPEFGIAIPEKYSIHGIDVSKYQQFIAWDAVKAMQVRKVKIEFVFIKATEGIGNTDGKFFRNWQKSKQAGITRGAYHFFLATKDGKKQAENFINAVELEPGDLPPVLDVEQTYGVNSVTLKQELKECLDVMENYYKVKPIIYTNVDFYKQYLGKDFDSYPLWAAHYFEYNEPRIKRDWLFWQHSEGGRVNGILFKVDFNVFNGDSTDFHNLLVD
ncbi:MAG: glycoside hydrolase family 25 protein [Chitinophagaceae bacterium]|nr:MAG: glycoside hydrolase family 25 protein [Chitinophagaceae bacterium]